MPFGVRRFPGSRDPRGALFCYQGFAWGGVPAIVYRFSTTGALAPFDRLNGAGVVVGFTFGTGGHHQWFNGDMTSDHLNLTFDIFGDAFGLDAGPTYSVEWILSITAPMEDYYIGVQRALYPDAINGWPTIALTQVGIGTNQIPNPVLITPCIWDTPLTL